MWRLAEPEHRFAAGLFCPKETAAGLGGIGLGGKGRTQVAAGAETELMHFFGFQFSWARAGCRVVHGGNTALPP